MLNTIKYDTFLEFDYAVEHAFFNVQCITSYNLDVKRHQKSYKLSRTSRCEEFTFALEETSRKEFLSQAEITIPKWYKNNMVLAKIKPGSSETDTVLEATLEYIFLTSIESRYATKGTIIPCRCFHFELVDKTKSVQGFKTKGFLCHDAQ